MAYLVDGVDIEANPYKKDFPLFGRNPEVAFLDSAATAQRPAAVLDAQREFYETMNANPLRGLYELSYAATNAINDTRKHVARFIGAGEDNWHDIVLCRNTSEALNLLAFSLSALVLEPGDEVCISIMEHHSNCVPWQMACKRHGAKLVYMYLDEEGHLTEEEMRAKIGPKTKIVSTMQVSNVLGVENDVKLLGRIAHENGAYMIVDGAQSVPHMPVDVSDLGCDFFAFSGHKVFGPMGIGILWGKHELLEAIPPFLTGGEMIDSVSEQSAVWAPVPEKFEAGTQDAAGMYALGAALTYVEGVGWEAMQSREAALTKYCMEELRKLDFVHIYGPKDAAEHHGVISFNVDKVHPHDVSGILDSVHVAIRAGHHCAQPLMSQLGCMSNCRASMAFYNDKADIDQLIDGLKLVWSMFDGI
jgi:cysteine desulfurase / selenocysteine lyase